MGWNYLSIPRSQRLQSWGWICNFIQHFIMDVFTLSTLWLKSIHVSKYCPMGPVDIIFSLVEVMPIGTKTIPETAIIHFPDAIMRHRTVCESCNINYHNSSPGQEYARKKTIISIQRHTKTFVTEQPWSFLWQRFNNITKPYQEAMLNYCQLGPKHINLANLELK